MTSRAPEALDAGVLQTFPRLDEARIDPLISAELARLKKKIVVLDDDPTGVQTVHNISVYTDWSQATLESAFAEDGPMFFILTNSRSFIHEQTVREHQAIARNLLAAAKKTGQEFILISRSDSTLRGHYPTETLTLKDELEHLTGAAFDGEIISPFFKEGGRFTINDTHYVKDGDQLIPAGQTEFARDKTFGYNASHLGEWCEEKTSGAYKASEMIYIPLSELRALDLEAVESRLLGARGFNKIILNAVDYCDVKVFAVALLRALGKGRHFLLRSAAAVPKVLGAVPDKPLLSRAELVGESAHGGIVIVGSHVNKTTRQLEELRNCHCQVEFIEFDQHLVLQPGGLQREVARVTSVVETIIEAGRTAAVYTRRDRLDLDTSDPERQLLISVEISNALTGIIAGLRTRPAFIIAKGGITSSDIGTKALRVRRATVMGQIRPGIPVWRTGPESKFPDMPYIIFPGNVGEVSTLREMVETLIG